MQNGVKKCDDGSGTVDPGPTCIFQNGVKKCSGADPGGSGACIVKDGKKFCDDGSGTPPPGPNCVYSKGVKKCGTKI